VYKAVKVSGRPFYGYHPRQHTFVKEHKKSKIKFFRILKAWSENQLFSLLVDFIDFKLFYKLLILKGQ